VRPYITSVITPATSRDLVTLADVREQLSIRSTDTAQDAWLAKVISRASAQAESYCNRIFVQQDYQDLFGVVSGDPGTPLLLRQPPVDVTLVTVDGTDLVATDFIADVEPGLLYKASEPRQWTSTSSITVQYTGGFAEVPDDVQQAVIELCVMEFRSRGRDPMLRERETPGMGRETFWIGPMPGVSGSQLPGDIASLLGGYARGLIG
jgi:gp6-like head-tail connector protein